MTHRIMTSLLVKGLLIAAISPGAAAAARPVEREVSSPLATDDQTAVDRQAMRLLHLPQIEQERLNTMVRWKNVLHDDPAPEDWASFESMIDDYTYNYAIKAVLDPNYPRVAHVYTQPHEWRGMKVPGSRWGGNNPDNVYRLIPIDGKARFRVDGKRFGTGPTVVTYGIVSDEETTWTSVQITDKDISYGADGTFSLTLDPQPAGGRRNHIQTDPRARFLFIRDTLGDWAQRPNALSIHRFDPPDAPPLTDEQAAERAAYAMKNGMSQVYYYVRMAHGKDNSLPDFPATAGSFGGVLTQKSSFGNARIGDDEALIVTINPDTARYYSLVAHNYWFISIDYDRHTSSLNNAQSIRNADGTLTYVVSLKDPGVHNWIDTGGVHNPILMIRLQGLAEGQPSSPWLKTRLVKLINLKAELPADTKWVTAADRKAQLDLRRSQYLARMADR